MAEAMAGLDIAELEAALLAQSAAADATAAAAQERIGILDALAVEQAALVASGKEVMNSQLQNNVARSTAAGNLAAAKEDITTATFAEDLAIEQQLYDLASTQTELLGGIQAEYQGTVRDLMSNLKVVQESEGLGIIDGLKDPIKFVTAKYQAGKAQREAAVQMEQLTTLDSAQQQLATGYVAQNSALQMKAQARQQQHGALYFREVQAAQVLGRLNQQKEVDDASMTAIIQAMGLTGAYAEELKAGLNAELQVGDMARAKFSSMAQTIQLKQAKEAFDAAAAEGARDNAIRESLEAKWPAVQEALGLEYNTYLEFQTALQGNMVDANTAVVAGNLMTFGVLGAAGAMNSGNPTEAIEVASKAPGQTWLTPEFMAVYGKLKREVTTNAASATPEQLQLDLNAKLTDMWSGSREDIDKLLVPARDVLQLTPPQALASADQLTLGLDGAIPVAALPMLQKLQVNVTRNTTFRALAGDVIDSVARDKEMDMELMAQAMAAYGSITLRNLNAATGFGLPRIATEALGPNGDATNPAHWYRAFQQRKAQLLRPASYSETLRQSTEQNR